MTKVMQCTVHMPTRLVVCESCSRHSNCRVVPAISTEELQRVCNNPYQVLNISESLMLSLQTPAKMREVTCVLVLHTLHDGMYGS